MLQANATMIINGDDSGVHLVVISGPSSQWTPVAWLSRLHTDTRSDRKGKTIDTGEGLQPTSQGWDRPGAQDRWSMAQVGCTQTAAIPASVLRQLGLSQEPIPVADSWMERDQFLIPRPAASLSVILSSLFLSFSSATRLLSSSLTPPPRPPHSRHRVTEQVLSVQPSASNVLDPSPRPPLLIIPRPF